MTFFKFLLPLALGLLPVSAQTPVPASPVEPIPAQPVGATAQPVNPAPAQPASVAPAGTNSPGAPPSIAVTVLADSSLRNVLQELAQTWADSQPTSPQVPLTLTNVASMRSQLESNPAWDVVISPGADEMKALTEKGILAPDGQQTLARNTLVIYGRKALVKTDELDWFDLVGDEWKKVAMGNPDLTVSGLVAKRALGKHDLFDDDHTKLYVLKGTENLALQVVERDQADAAFVYRTDLTGIDLPGFEVFPLSSVDAPPVFYSAALGRLAKNPDLARSFITYCSSEAARDIWTKYGFEVN